MKNKHELTNENVRMMRRSVGAQRKIWTDRYRDIRHKVYAHSGLKSEADEEALFEQTNIGEIVGMLAFLDQIYHSLWEAYFNGRAPDLAPRGPKFPVPDMATREHAGERVYREAAQALYLLKRTVMG